MTGWGVERTRTAHPATVAPVGAREPMPPHSQGAERRTRRTRWGLRALVIGGLAGAAWLLTGTAAQAADHDATPGGLLGPSLIGAVLDGDTAAPTVGKILKVAAKPLDRDRPAQKRPVAPLTVLTETLDEVTTDAGSTLGAVDRVVREVSGPLRLTGGPADSPLTEPLRPLTEPLRPVTDLLNHVAPATASRPAPANPPAVDVATPRPAPATAPVADEAAQHPASAPASEPAKAAVPAGAEATTETVAASDGEQHSVRTARHPAAVTATVRDTVRDTRPDGDGPAPLQVHLGASGISTSASGAPAEGGSAAYLPSTVAGDTVADRSPNAADVGVRRHDAEAPTVSPD